MKTFIYTATDVQGNTVKNARMQAEDVNDFLDKINEKGLFCSSYKETNSKGDKNIYKFKTKELSFNCRQLSAMISSGLTLVKALDILYKEQPKEATKRVFREVYDEVQKGRLAGSGFAENRDDALLREGKGHVLQSRKSRVFPRVILPDSREFKKRVSFIEDRLPNTFLFHGKPPKRILA